MRAFDKQKVSGLEHELGIVATGGHDEDEVCFPCSLARYQADLTLGFERARRENDAIKASGRTYGTFVTPDTGGIFRTFYLDITP